MPMVNGKKFPYTAKGMKKAKEQAKKIAGKAPSLKKKTSLKKKMR